MPISAPNCFSKFGVRLVDIPSNSIKRQFVQNMLQGRHCISERCIEFSYGRTGTYNQSGGYLQNGMLNMLAIYIEGQERSWGLGLMDISLINGLEA